MALTEQTIVDKIQIVGEWKHVQVVMARVIYDDGVEISRNTQNLIFTPDTDTTAESAELQAICAAVHTDEVKAAYALRVAADAAADEAAEATP
jgi:hypothetical protein|tara:strand:- start:30 stop:308 length:279 start_codon:yes stop_codon:yes gene_type:complete